MKQPNFFLVCAAAASLAITFMPSGLLSGQTLQPDSCHVTTPNGIVAGSSERNEKSYGNALLSVGPFGLWPNGTVVFKPGGAGFQTKDEGLGMKFGWTRGIPGKLNVTGRRRCGNRSKPLVRESENQAL